jgi:hypothetical protein
MANYKSGFLTRIGTVRYHLNKSVWNFWWIAGVCVLEDTATA